MKAKHYGALIGVIYLAVAVLFVVFILAKKSVAQPPKPTPSKIQHWECDPNHPGECRITDDTGPNTYTDQPTCIRACKRHANGYCTWSPAKGYTGYCQANADGSDGTPLSSPCTDPSKTNTECAARKKNQLVYCNGTFCKDTTDPWCTSSVKNCKKYSCCLGGKVVDSTLPPSQVGPTCRLSPEKASCATPNYAVTYYWCDPSDETCKFSTQASVPNFSDGRVVSTNPKEACLLENSDCYRNVYWRTEGTNPNTWCNWAVTTRGTSPNADGGNAWSTYMFNDNVCKGAPIPRSGWCFRAATDQNDPSCAAINPNLATCMGSIVPVDRVWSCDVNGNAQCAPNTLPNMSSFGAGEACCPQGAFTADGRAEAGSGAQCLPILPGCACFNAATQGSQGACSNGQVEWDGTCYDACLPRCDGSSTFPELIVKKCRSEASISATGGKDASVCKSIGECMCRFPPENHNCDNTAAWTAMCGSALCNRNGCVGCTVEEKDTSKLPSTTVSFISQGYSTRKLNPDAGEGDFLICPDGTDCQVGDAVKGKSALLIELKNAGFNPTCLKSLTPYIAHCVTDPNTACVPASTILPKGMSDCITYNSMESAWEGTTIGKYMADLENDGLCIGA